METTNGVSGDRRSRLKAVFRENRWMLVMSLSMLCSLIGASSRDGWFWCALFSVLLAFYAIGFALQFGRAWRGSLADSQPEAGSRGDAL